MTKRNGPADGRRIAEAVTARLIRTVDGPGIVVHELGIDKGSRRVDVALVTARTIAGFEIKSDADGWQRLAG